MAQQLRRRDFLRTAALTTSAGLLAACQPKVVEKVVKETVEVEKVIKETVMVEGTPQVVEKVVTVQSAPAEPTKIRFSVWGDVQDKDVYTKMVYEFMQEQGAIIPSIEQYLGGYYEKIITNFAAGNAADIIYMQGWVWQPYEENGQLYRLDDFIERDGRQSWWPEFQSFQQGTSWHGGTFMTPSDSSGWLQIYNKDLFDERGVPYPTDDWSWEDFQIAVEKLSFEKDGIRYYGFAEMNWYPFYWLTPARKDGLLEYDRIVEPTKAMWNQDGIVEAMEWYAVETVKAGWMPDPSILAGGGVSVWSGRVAMCWDGNWRLPRMWGDKADKEGGINYNVSLVPKGASGKAETAPFVHGHSMTSATEHAEESWQFLSFILSEKGQGIVAEGGRGCGRPEMIDKLWVPLAIERYNCENAQAFARAMEEGRQIVIAGEGGGIDAVASAGGPMPMAHDKMIAGTSAREALDEMNAGIQAVLDAYWAKR